MVSCKLHRVSLALLLGCAPVAVQAETLGEVLLKAYETNPTLEISRALTKVSDEGVTAAKAAYGPTLSAEVSHSYTYSQTHLPDNELNDRFSEDGFATQGEISLTQPVLTFGRLASQLDLAQAQRLGAHQDLRADSQNLIFDVITAYVSLRRDLELYAVASDTYRLLAEQRALTARRLELRDATAPDVDQTGNRMEIAAGRVIQARGNLEATAASFRSLVGDYPAELAPPPMLPALGSLDQIYAQAETSSPVILSSLHTERATEAQIASARSNMMPRVDLNAAVGRIPLSAFENTNYSNQVIAGVTVVAPLYTGGRLASNLRTAEVRNQAAQQFVEEARRSVRQSIASDWNQLQAASLALPRFQAAVETAQRAVDGVRQQQTAGIRTLRDVLDVTNDLFTARTLAVQAQASQYIQHAAVLRDAGLLTIDLFADRGEYDPTSYQPGLAGLAGLPLSTIIEPLDSVFVFDGTDEVPVVIEDDLVYEPGASLTLPDGTPPMAN